MLDTLEMFRKKWIREGFEIGFALGFKEGFVLGLEQGIARTKKETVSILLRNGRMTAEEISQDFNIPLEEVLEIAGRIMN